MAGCGYVCPVCEGRGYMEDGKPCDYCIPQKDLKEISDEEWIDQVHNQCSCSDLGKDKNSDEEFKQS